MKLQHLRNIAFLIFTVSSLCACMATESLVHVPSQSGMAEVDEYNIALHQQSVHIFNPMRTWIKHSSFPPKKYQFRIQKCIAKVCFH